MEIECDGFAIIKIKSTEKLIFVYSDELDWDKEIVDDKDMGPEIRHFASVSLPAPLGVELGQVIWQIWEYPIGVENFRKIELEEGFELIKNFDLKILWD